MNENDSKQEKLETFTRKSNIKCHGITDNPDATPEQFQEKVFDFVKDTLGIDTMEITTERAHRLPSWTENPPIIVQFTHIRHRNIILSAFRQKRKQIVFSTRVSEDFSDRGSKARTGLYPRIKESIDQCKRTYFNHDQLVVDCETYKYDTVQKTPVRVTK